MMPKITFVYFDLGNVLLHFHPAAPCLQMAKAIGLDPRCFVHFFEAGNYVERLETGETSSRDVLRALVEMHPELVGGAWTETNVIRAGCDIFSINTEIVPLVAQLWLRGLTLGVLSNTSASHWDFVTDGRFGILPGLFEIHALSYRLRAMKPHPQIYQRATELAGVPPEHVFFTDDRRENVEAAAQLGWQTHHFLGDVRALATSLRNCGINLNF